VVEPCSLLPRGVPCCSVLQPVVSEEFSIKMEASLKMWVSAWDSKGYSPEHLDKGEHKAAPPDLTSTRFYTCMMTVTECSIPGVITHECCAIL
jgi:hypothetical protein